LDHVTGFPVIGGVIEAGGDDHAGVVFVEDVAVQREPFSKRKKKARA
jgi:hypothetical protein